MDFDLALRDNEPAKPTEDTTTEKKNEYEKWIKVNRMALLFKESEKAEIGTLMNTLITTKYLGGGVREHILLMVDAAAKLNALNIKIDDVHLALNSLPPEYSQLKSTYIAQKEKWDLNECIAICVHEEQNIRQDKGKKQVNVVESVNPPNGKNNLPQKNNKRSAGRGYISNKVLNKDEVSVFVGNEARVVVE
ncbi:uncharacterized protein [Pyrus communis]|uniref:uncharacterized protein n=1 Tax=Pyrus communis TaxID=23211 RepID=UPI0035BF1BB4